DKEKSNDGDDEKQEKLKDEEPIDTSKEKEKNQKSTSTKQSIKKICSTTEYPEDCVNSISPLVTGPTDRVSLLKIELKAIKKGFVTAIARAKKIRKDTKRKMDKSTIDTCVENFSSGLIDLENAIDAINDHDRESLQIMLSSIITYISTCEDAIGEDPDTSLPEITQMENKLKNLVTNCMDMADEFH
ncbi:hypothetical protein LINGRAHAP2_LOCUS15095, partial [Linum grandiflorum]